MSGHANSEIHVLFGQWKDEDRDLDSYVDTVRDWMNDVSKLGIPRFGETANRLQRLRERLKTHFEREDTIGGQLQDLYSGNSAELTAACRQAQRDHSLLITRLDSLISRLDEVDPPFASWEAAMEQFEMFIVALEQHEDQELDSIEMLMPPPRKG